MTNKELATFIADSIRKETDQGALYILNLTKEINYGHRS